MTEGTRIRSVAPTSASHISSLVADVAAGIDLNFSGLCRRNDRFCKVEALAEHRVNLIGNFRARKPKHIVRIITRQGDDIVSSIKQRDLGREVISRIADEGRHWRAVLKKFEHQRSFIRVPSDLSEHHGFASECLIRL